MITIITLEFPIKAIYADTPPDNFSRSDVNQNIQKTNLASESLDLNRENHKFTLEVKNRLLDIHAKNTSFKVILKELEKKARIKVNISEGIADKKVSLNIKSLPLYAISTLLTEMSLKNFAVAYDDQTAFLAIYILPEGKDISKITKGKPTITYINVPDVKKTIDTVKGKKIVSTIKGKNKVPVRYVGDEILLKFHLGISQDEIQEILGKYNFIPAGDDTLSKIGYIKAKIPDGRDPISIIKQIRKEYKIKIPEPNYISTTLTVSDPFFKDQWYIPDTNFDKAWEKVKINNPITVAVIDSGVDGTHPDLKGKILDGYNFVEDSNDASDVHGHGTFVAGIIAATSNNIGIKGLYDYAQIIPVKVIDEKGLGTYEDAAKGIIYAADNGARVINLSIGGYAYSFMLQDAIDYALEQGCILVAAGGNDGIEQEMFPAAYPDVIGVSALDPNEKIWLQSNSGRHIDVCAPGVDVISTGLGCNYVYATGTSTSTPMVSALAAMLMSEKQDLSSAFVRRLIIQSAEDLGEKGVDRVYGGGEIDSDAALNEKVKPFHDVAVRSVHVEPMIFAKGKPIYIVSNVENRGTYNSELCDFVIYEIDGEVKKEIGRQEGVDVIDKTRVIFKWTTEGLKEGVKFEVSVISEDDLNTKNDRKKSYTYNLREKNGVHVLYAVQPPIHQWIALQAWYALPTTGSSLKTEMSSFLPIDPASPYYGHYFDPSAPDVDDWSDDPKEPDTQSTSLIEGTWEEDMDDLITEEDLPTRPRNHFWDPTSDYDHGMPFSFSALELAQEDTFKKAIDYYIDGDKMRGYYWLGRTAHLLMDMSVPAHVQLDPHWPDWAVGGDEYEDFLASWEFHYKHTTSESSNAYMRDYRDLPYTKASSYTPEDKDYNDDLTNLFYSLATFADWYDSDNEDGESATRYNMAHNAFDYTKNVTAVWYTTFGIEQYDALADGHCFVVNCNWSHDASIIYTNQLLINSISGLGAGVTVHYTSGETEYFGEVEDESNVPWAVCGQILQPELETRAIGYVAALYQLFWDETHPRTFTHIIVDGDYEVDENSGAQYTCTAHYDDGTDSDVTSSASWSDNSSYASISSSGYLTTSAVPADQPCRITASYLGDSDTHDITIKNITTTPTAGTPSSIAVPLSDSDGSYTVSWGASSTSSVTYVLEEATNPSFTSDLRPAYSGSSLSMMITGRSSGTTYYYRVKATRSGYADSDWKECTNGCTVGITSDESLIAYYPFNGNANDESGNGNHGTVYGATLTTDRLGNTDSAYEFDGQASYIEVPDSSSLDITGPITISAYIKADFDQYFRVGLVTKKSEYHPCPGYQLFLSDMNDNGVNYARFGLVYIDPEAPNGDAEIYVGSNTALNDNQWHHIATTYDGSNVKMYIEGRLEDVTLFDGLCGENDEPLFIGLYPYAYSDGHGNLPNILKGCIDEVRIYNRALSTSEIRQLSGTGYKDSLQSIFLLLLDN